MTSLNLGVATVGEVVRLMSAQMQELIEQGDIPGVSELCDLWEGIASSDSSSSSSSSDSSSSSPPSPTPSPSPGVGVDVIRKVLDGCPHLAYLDLSPQETALLAKPLTLPLYDDMDAADTAVSQVIHTVFGGQDGGVDDVMGRDWATCKEAGMVAFDPAVWSEKLSSLSAIDDSNASAPHIRPRLLWYYLLLVCLRATY